MLFLRSLLPLSLSLVVGCGSSNNSGFSNSANGTDASAGASGGVGSGAGGKGTGTGTGGKGTGGNGTGNGTGGSTGGGGAGTSGGALGIGADAGFKDAGPTEVGDAARVRLDAALPPAEAAVCAGTVCGVCTDLASDPLNCGACGAAVCHNEACNGVKVCAPGLRACGGAGTCLGCRNLRSDPTNCGACGTVCTANEVCSGGNCGVPQSATCSGGLTRCSGGPGLPGACVDTSTDITNCGACKKNCSPGEFCAAGSCTKYVTAPGCRACPCAACTAAADQCCRYADGNVCATKCPGG